MSLPSDNHWTLDKRVPLVLVLAIVLQTGGIVWWAATQNAATAQNAEDTAELALRVERIELSAPTVSERLTRVETTLSIQTGVLQQILAEVRRSPNE